MKRLVTVVNNEEYKRVQQYCKKKRISLYRLVKDAVFEKMENDK